MPPKFRETQNWYLSRSVLRLQGSQSNHFTSAEIDMKDSLKRKPVVTGSQVHFIMLSIAWQGDVIDRIYQSGKASSEQEGIVRIQVKSKNSDKTIPRKTDKKHCPVSLRDTHGHSRASARARLALAMFKIRSGNAGHAGQALI